MFIRVNPRMTHGYRMINLLLFVPSYKPHVQQVIKVVVWASVVASKCWSSKDDDPRWEAKNFPHPSLSHVFPLHSPMVATCVRIKSLHPEISIHILHTVLSAFWKVLTRRICLTVKSFFCCWPFSLFSWPVTVRSQKLPTPFSLSCLPFTFANGRYMCSRAKGWFLSILLGGEGSWE